MVVRTSQSRYINNALFHSINIFFFIPWCSYSFVVSGVWNLSNLIQCQVSWPVKRASPLKSRSSVIVFLSPCVKAQHVDIWSRACFLPWSQQCGLKQHGTRTPWFLNKSSRCCNWRSFHVFFCVHESWSNNLELHSWLALYFLVSVEPMAMKDSWFHGASSRDFDKKSWKRVESSQHSLLSWRFPVFAGDRRPTEQWKKGPWLVRVYRGWKSTQFYMKSDGWKWLVCLFGGKRPFFPGAKMWVSRRVNLKKWR